VAASRSAAVVVSKASAVCAPSGGGGGVVPGRGIGRSMPGGGAKAESGTRVPGQSSSPQAVTPNARSKTFLIRKT